MVRKSLLAIAASFLTLSTFSTTIAVMGGGGSTVSAEVA